MDSFDQLEEAVKAVQNGEITINEARAKTGKPPIANGDVRLVIEGGVVVAVIGVDGIKRPFVKP